MLDLLFLFGVVILLIGALVLIGQAALFYMNRSNLYVQERYDKAFKQIVKREKQLDKQRARNERHTADERYYI